MNWIKNFNNHIGFLDFSEAERLYELVSNASKKGPCLEIGTYCGKSSLVIAEACAANDSYLITVDHHIGSEEHQPGEEYFNENFYDKRLDKFNTYPVFRSYIENFPNKESILPAVGDSKEVSSLWPKNYEIGLLFIDGSHSKKSAFSDFKAWSDFICKDGYLLIHDVFPDPNDGGRPPYELFEYVMETNQFKLIELYKTLGILKKI